CARVGYCSSTYCPHNRFDVW
nr:immunoglobulin heavy chain junction region [Macaca mulatta]